MFFDGRRSIRALIFSLAVSLLAACAVQQGSLKNASEHGAFTPRVAYTYEASSGFSKVLATLILRPGRYEAVGQDDSGVWYLGEPDSFVSWAHENNRGDGKLVVAIYRGGVFVPRDKSAAAKLFYILADEKIYLADPSTLGNLERFDFSTRQFINETWGQAFTSGPVSGATIVGSAIGAPIAASLTEYNAKGFWIYRSQPPVGSKPLRSWLTEAN